MSLPRLIAETSRAEIATTDCIDLCKILLPFIGLGLKAENSPATFSMVISVLSKCFHYTCANVSPWEGSSSWGEGPDNYLVGCSD